MDEQYDASDEEKKGVRKIRIRRAIGFLMMLLYVPICGFIGNISISVFFAGLFGFAYFFFMAFLLFIVSFSKCPRCKNKFFYMNGFASQCAHCGLSIKA